MCLLSVSIPFPRFWQLLNKVFGRRVDDVKITVDFAAAVLECIAVLADDPCGFADSGRVDHDLSLMN